MLFPMSFWDFLDLCLLQCLNNLKPEFHALLGLNPSSLLILPGCNFISIASSALRSL
jgi:hypothetical protein